MRVAFEAVGGRCTLTCEIDEAALQTYNLNFKGEDDHAFVNDIRKLTAKLIPKHDVLLAGFPCQPYSIAGLRMGLKDDRGAIFMDLIRILKTRKPKAILLENVKGILAHDQGQTFKYMIDLIQGIGYTAKYQTLNSMTHANVPQNRERVFVVGFLDKQKALDFQFPKPIKLRRSIHDCIETQPVSKKYFYDERYEIYADIRKLVISRDSIYQWRRRYVRENKSQVCPTLTANMGSGGHNVPLIRVSDGIRRLTPRECANFQGFPKSFKLSSVSDSKLYHQLGNSVTIPLIRRIAREMIRVL